MTRDEIASIAAAVVPTMRELFSSMTGRLNGLEQTNEKQAAQVETLKAEIAALTARLEAVQVSRYGDPAPGRDEIRALVLAELEAVPRPADGRDGQDGRDGLPGAPGAPGRDGKDGAPGRDGADGLGPEDITETLEADGRVLVRQYLRGGAVVKECRHVTVTPIDRGTWREGQAYQRGDIVTWAGSQWIAQVDTSAKPETCADWRLSVKRGRDGRDGKDGKPGERGPAGKDFRP